MTHLKHEKKITWFIVTTFIAQVVITIAGGIIWPPDFSGEFPIYYPDSIVVMSYGAALFLAGLTVMGLKLADEKLVLPAAGFTMLAISGAILMASLFEISSIVSIETYEKFYRIQSSSAFLYLPAMYLISSYEAFKKWVRYVGLVSSFPLLAASFMFLAGHRDFHLLETISNTGFFMMFFTEICWAVNIYLNYKRKVSPPPAQN